MVWHDVPPDTVAIDRYSLRLAGIISTNQPMFVTRNRPQQLASDCMSYALFPSIGSNIHYARFGLGAQFDTTVEQIRRNYTTTVSQMRCPYHHKDAWVAVEGGENNTFDIDIVTCCQEFEQRVRQSLMDPV